MDALPEHIRSFWHAFTNKPAGYRNLCVDVPPNKMDFSGATPPTCDHCGSPATSRCKNCPITDSSHYCNRECQKHDWKYHKYVCKDKQFYALLKDFDMRSQSPEESNEQHRQPILDAQDATQIKAPYWYWKYLADVTPDRRLVRLFLGDDGHGARLSEATRRAIVSLASSTTRAEHETRTGLLAATTDSYVEVNAQANVPLVDRKLITLHGKPADTGIPLFPCDYDVVSAGNYKYYWGNGSPVIGDPWELGLEGDVLLDDVPSHEELLEKGVVRQIEPPWAVIPV